MDIFRALSAACLLILWWGPPKMTHFLEVKMTKKMFFATIGFVVFGLSGMAQAKSLNDVKAARCVGAKGSFIQVETAKRSIRGKIGALKEIMSNGVQGEAFGVLNDYPGAGWTALGGLVADKNGYWGNLSVVTESNRNLGAKETLKGFFTDVEGRAQVEEMACDLAF